MPSNEVLPSSPQHQQQQPTKTRSFDDRECLRTATATNTASDLNASSKCIDSTKSGDASHEKRKSSENISLHCENNEPNNTNFGQENIPAVLSNVSDTNLNGARRYSTLSDGEKVRSESLSLSASPPKITVMCAPCIDVILAESASQHTETIECDVSDSEETAQETKNDELASIIEDVATASTAAEATHCTKDASSRKASSPTPNTSNLQLSLEVKKTTEPTGQQEDLSPSMDEYEECNPTSGDYQYDTITGGEMLVPGCVAPAPTPAPLIAPLAEIEVDPPDDDVTGIEKPPGIHIDPVNLPDAESTAKSQPEQQQPQTTRTKPKKKQKSTDKGNI